MKKLNLLFLAILFASLSITSCSSDDGGNIYDDNNNYKDAILIVNQGGFTKNEASVSAYKNGKSTVDIFKKQNPDKNLGDVAQSILLQDNVGYIVINNSNKIEVVDATTFKWKSTITDNIKNPRYAAIKDQYLYITNWGDPLNSNDDYVSVHKVSDLSYVKSIPVAEGPEQILIDNNKLVIAHSGGWSRSNLVTIHNLLDNTSKKLAVGDSPNSFVKENKKLYVLCSGYPYDPNKSNGTLAIIDLDNDKIENSFVFNEGENPAYMVEANNRLYYTLNKHVYSIGFNDAELPKQPLFKVDAVALYAFNIIDNVFYFGDAKNYSSNGEVKMYNQLGNILGNFTIGVGPTQIIKN